MAKYYKVDPDIPSYEWDIADFMDREEYMNLHNDFESKYSLYLRNKANTPPDTPGVF